MSMTQEQWRTHAHTHDKSNSWWLKDAKGIECARVCHEPGCVEAVKARYHPEVFGEGRARYEDVVEETIEPDDY
jgi:hypothetical protein